MNAIQLLEKQFQSVNAVLHDVVDDLSDNEWLSRLSPHQNIFAFSAWHLPRVQDNFVHTWIRNVPEIYASERWQEWRHFQKYSEGVGIQLHEADIIARHVKQNEVLEYSDLVTTEIISWLHTLSNNNLDQIPDATAHLSVFSEYQTQGYKSDTDHLIGKPIWRLLSGTCISHVRGHLGELDLQKTILREN
jgi:hypothetical protein